MDRCLGFFCFCFRIRTANLLADGVDKSKLTAKMDAPRATAVSPTIFATDEGRIVVDGGGGSGLLKAFIFASGMTQSFDANALVISFSGCAVKRTRISRFGCKFLHSSSALIFELPGSLCSSTGIDWLPCYLGRATNHSSKGSPQQGFIHVVTAGRYWYCRCRWQRRRESCP